MNGRCAQTMQLFFILFFSRMFWATVGVAEDGSRRIPKVRHISFIDSNKGRFRFRLSRIIYTHTHTLTHVHGRYYTHNTDSGFPRSMGSNERRGSVV